MQVYGLIGGACCNVVCSKVLKRLIGQHRPIQHSLFTDKDKLNLDESNDNKNVIKKNKNNSASSSSSSHELGHGMPSSHAMSLSFISTFVCLGMKHIRFTDTHLNTTSINLTPFEAILHRITPLFIQSYWNSGFLPRSILGLLFAFIIWECNYRIRIKYHTFAQIVVGLVIGGMNGLLFHEYAMPFIRSYTSDWRSMQEKSTLEIVFAAVSIGGIGAVLLDRNSQKRVKKWLKQCRAFFSSSDHTEKKE